MAKNIVVFSDGTGQEGGLREEQRLSNVYKLYRVCGVGPDSGINPRDQVAFYDAGLGTDAGATGLTGAYRRIQKLLSSVTGLGITRNIVDCYEFILNHYEPGDRIFLVGFSRGGLHGPLRRQRPVPVRGADDRPWGLPATLPQGDPGHR